MLEEGAWAGKAEVKSREVYGNRGVRGSGAGRAVS